MTITSRISKTTRLVAVALSATALTLIISSPAQATWLRGECSTTGARGWIDADWYQASDRVDFMMNYMDTLADGHHARARLITEDVNGVIKYWPWHSDTNGANNGYESHNSYAINDSGVFNWGIQVGRFEGSTRLNACADWGIH